MHIPDAVLSPPVWATLNVVAVPAVVLLSRRAEQAWPEGRLPLLGILGAFVFAAQMVNFPVGPGTSGHLVGAALLAATLGPASASLVMTAILGIQALLFQDGGLLALGANVCNMALAGVWAGWLPFVFVRERRTAAFLGGALSVLVAGGLTLAELVLSGVPVAGAVLAVTAGLFAVNALLEGLITAAVLASIVAIHPEWLRRPSPRDRRAAALLGGAALLLVLGGMLVASVEPDTLERLMERAGVEGSAAPAPFPDYEWPSLTSPWLRKAAPGLAGVAVVYALCLLLARRLGRAMPRPGA